MATRYYNPRNPVCAAWASAVELHLRQANPDLTLAEIRQLPMMQGVFQHLSDLKAGKKQPPLNAKVDNPIDRAAQLSQYFLNVGTGLMLFTYADAGLYDTYINWLDNYNNTANPPITDYSTDDLGGFGLCLIVWVGLVGLPHFTGIEKDVIDDLIKIFPYNSTIKGQISTFWENMAGNDYSLQYRDASDNPSYQTIPWLLPANNKWQVVMLGDWGTALDDAHEFLYALWKQAYTANPDKTIVFIHLGDIYYCGLPEECQNNFYDVFVSVGARLQSDLGNPAGFEPNPPIFTIPGNHEYYSYGYGYYQLLDTLNRSSSTISGNIIQTCSFFNLRSADGFWQFTGMDTGQSDSNALEALCQAAQPYVIDIIEALVPFSYFFDDTITEIYQDMVGPFAPTLQPTEVTWLQNRISEFNGKTILCSHHQLFSRQAQLDHKDPEYLNSSLLGDFQQYFKNKIAAWYWGHEHTYAVYMDGIFGLNKGRLLGSSSYEANQENDSPYKNNYPMVPFDTSMSPIPIKTYGTDKLYYHAAAIFIPNNNELGVTYYQFPAWSNLDSQPSSSKLVLSSIYSETITGSFKTLAPTWIGNLQIEQNDVVTDKSPVMTVANNTLYLIFANGSNVMSYATADISNYRPTSKSTAPPWVFRGVINLNGKGIGTTNSPATVAVGNNVYVFCQNNGALYVLTYVGNSGTWSSSRVEISSNNPLQVGDAGLAACYFNNLIYVVYREYDSGNNLCWATYDPMELTWSFLGEITDSSGDKFESELIPALAVSPYRMIMAFQQSGSSDDIQWAEYTETDNNWSWTRQNDISTTDKNGNSTTPDTTVGLTLAYHSGAWYLIYVDSSNDLRLCAMDDSTNTWHGNSTIIANANHNSSTPQSSKAPALVISNGGGFLIYRGNTHDEIYWAYF